MYNLDFFRELSMMEFMERMGFERSRNNNFICPFCESGTGSDKTSAFYAKKDAPVFFCHACLKQGNMFQFMQEWKNLTFIEALRELAGIYGISEEETDLKPMIFQVFDKVRTFYRIEDAIGWEKKLHAKVRKDNIRSVRIWIATLNGYGIIKDSHWLCRCLGKTFNPDPSQLSIIINHTLRGMNDFKRVCKEK